MYQSTDKCIAEVKIQMVKAPTEWFRCRVESGFTCIWTSSALKTV